jgi:YrbI family 3-deoxy-D-manno-octulosonate 8-phosphate phosphatase
MTNMEILALIPARGGSKSIPRKNIRPFAGHPLIAYSIAAGLNARSVTRVIVSTDDEDIAEIARSYGAETPFLRPAPLAQDNTLDLPVFRHALDWLAEHEGYRPGIVVQLRPTSPVRPSDCVDRAVGLLLEHPEADSVRGVVPSAQNPYKMWQIDAAQHMVPLLCIDGLSEAYNAPRQALPDTYWQTGHIDAIRVDTILRKDSMSGEVIVPLLIDPRYTVDIDSLSDWMWAEWLVAQAEMDIVFPGVKPRPWPERVDLLVLDFDGVITDNRVWVDENGHEQIAANRTDGLAIGRLRKAGVEIVVLSTEPNPVVAARCRKLGIPYTQGQKDKGAAFRRLLEEYRIDPSRVIYLGNDVNDVPCFPLAGFAAVVADAQPAARRLADMTLSRRGGYGAVAELCDLILARNQ